MERFKKYRCQADREIGVEISSGDTMAIIFVDGVQILSDTRIVAVQADFGEGRRLIEGCGRCVNNPTRACDLSLKISDLSPQPS